MKKILLEAQIYFISKRKTKHLSGILVKVCTEAILLYYTRRATYCRIWRMPLTNWCIVLKDFKTRSMFKIEKYKKKLKKWFLVRRFPSFSNLLIIENSFEWIMLHPFNPNAFTWYNDKKNLLPKQTWNFIKNQRKLEKPNIS